MNHGDSLLWMFSSDKSMEDSHLQLFYLFILLAFKFLSQANEWSKKLKL